MTRKSGLNRNLITTVADKPILARRQYDYTTKDGIIQGWLDKEITREEMIIYYRTYLHKTYGGLKPPKED